MASPNLDATFGAGVLGTFGNASTHSFASSAKAAGTNEVICVVYTYEINSASRGLLGLPPTVAGLTFTRQFDVQNTAGGNTSGGAAIEVWTAPASTQFNSAGSSLTWNMNFSASVDNCDYMVFAVQGCSSITQPFDAEAQPLGQAWNTSAGTPPTVTFSTSTADCLLIGLMSYANNSAGTPTFVPPTGWTNYQAQSTSANSNYAGGAVDYKSVSGVQTNATYLNGCTKSVIGYASMVIAFTADAQAVTLPPYLDSLFGVLTTIWTGAGPGSVSSTKQTTGAAVIVAVVQYDLTAGSGLQGNAPTATGLTFTRVASIQNLTAGAHTETIEVWTAPATSQFNAAAANLTWSFPTAASVDCASAIMFAVAGVASVASPLDNNAGLPATAFNASATTPPTVTFSTTQLNDLLVAITGQNGNGGNGGYPVGPTGWRCQSSIVSTGGTHDRGSSVDIKQVDAAQASATYANSNANTTVGYTELVLAFTANPLVVPHPGVIAVSVCII